MRAFGEGAMVHTNLALNADEVERRGWTAQWVKLPVEPQEWKNVVFAGKEGAENLLLVDEAALMFHVHDQQKMRDNNREIFELLVWSRKAGLDVYFISQSAQNLDAQLRRLTEIRVHCVSVKMIPFVGWFAKVLLGDFKRIRYGGGDGKNSIGGTYHRFNPVIGKFYSTEDTCGRSMGLQQGGSQRTVKKNQDKKTALIAGGLLLFFICFGAWRFYVMLWGGGIGGGVPKVEHPPEAVAAGQKEVQAGARPASAGKPAQPTEAVQAGPRTFTLALGDTVMEWTVQPEDELIVSAEFLTPLRVFCRGGVSLAVGGAYEGDRVTSIVSANQRHYVLLKSGRRLVCRKPTQEEITQWKLSMSTRPVAPLGPLAWGQSSAASSK